MAPQYTQYFPAHSTGGEIFSVASLGALFRVDKYMALCPKNDTEELKPFTENILNPSVRRRYKRVYAKMNKQRIPYWKDMHKIAVDAHVFFLDVYAIAWDFVITPDGALLLEGNTGWGSRVPQVFNGALLNKGPQIL